MGKMVVGIAVRSVHDNEDSAFWKAIETFGDPVHKEWFASPYEQNLRPGMNHSVIDVGIALGDSRKVLIGFV